MARNPVYGNFANMILGSLLEAIAIYCLDRVPDLLKIF
jgi:hypothetical protein